MVDHPLANLNKGPRRYDVYGLCVHTTGRGVLEKAAEWKVTPTEAAIRIYSKSRYGPHYLINHEGVRYRFVTEDRITYHTGDEWRPKYLDGSWKHHTPAEAVKRWQAAWPAYSSPLGLMPPNRAANRIYLGVEMIPCGAKWGVPRAPGELFTDLEYEAVAALALELGTRWPLPSRWWGGPRLVGHEDVGIADRSDAHGGWDPGNLREKPYFSMPHLRERITARADGVIA